MCRGLPLGWPRHVVVTDTVGPASADGNSPGPTDRRARTGQGAGPLSCSGGAYHRVLTRDPGIVSNMDRTPHTAPRGARGPQHDGETDGGGGFWLGLILAVLVGALVVGTVLVLDRPEPEHAPVTLSPSVDSWQEAAVECANHPDGGKRLVVEFGPTHDEDEFACTEQ